MASLLETAPKILSLLKTYDSMAPYTGNTGFVTEEELGALSASLSNLKIFSAVIDKLEIIKKGIVVAKDEVETDWFRLQEELADCFCQLQAVKNTDNSYPMLEAKMSLMEEVAALKKIVDEVCPLIIRPKNGTSMEMSASYQLAVTAPKYEDTGQQEQTSQSESESESQSRRINWYSVEKKHDSAGSCEQEIQYRMVGRQRSDLSTERLKRSIDIKNSVRRRRENRVCEIETIHSNGKEENAVKWVFESAMNETTGFKRENTVGEMKGIHSNEKEENVIKWAELEDPRNELKDHSAETETETETESRSRDMNSDRVADSWDNFSCETERIAETVASEPITAGDINGLLVEMPRSFSDRYSTNKKKRRRDKFFRRFSRWFCGTNHEYS